MGQGSVHASFSTMGLSPVLYPQASVWALPLLAKRLSSIRDMSFQTSIQDFPLSHFTRFPPGFQHQLPTGITTYLLPKLLETCSGGQANMLPTHTEEFPSRTAHSQWAA